MKEIKVDVNYDKDCNDVSFTITGVTFNHNNLFDTNTLMFFMPKDKAEEFATKTFQTLQDMELSKKDGIHTH